MESHFVRGPNFGHRKKQVEAKTKRLLISVILCCLCSNSFVLCVRIDITLCYYQLCVIFVVVLASDFSPRLTCSFLDLTPPFLP